ncbi:MAG: CHAD domain-containing protein [Nitrososphaera sp.]
MPDGAQFAKNFKASAARVKKRLAAYLDDPGDEENVHAMRTSLRRLEAALSLLPKKERKKNKEQANAYRAFFRANSRVRDLDIVRARVAALGGERFVSAVAGRRKVALGRALAMARSVEKNNNKMQAVSAKNIDGDELAARMDKVAGRLVRAIEERLPVVAGDGSKKEELHELRKDMKKLRYVLEVLPSGRRKKHGKEVARVIGGRSAIARLKELQAMLGQIRDCDITIEYLQGITGAEAILQKEEDERNALYEKFAKMVAG